MAWHVASFNVLQVNAASCGSSFEDVMPMDMDNSGPALVPPTAVVERAAEHPSRRVPATAAATAETAVPSLEATPGHVPKAAGPPVPASFPAPSAVPPPENSRVDASDWQQPPTSDSAPADFNDCPSSPRPAKAPDNWLSQAQPQEGASAPQRSEPPPSQPLAASSAGRPERNITPRPVAQGNDVRSHAAAPTAPPSPPALQPQPRAISGISRQQPQQSQPVTCQPAEPPASGTLHRLHTTPAPPLHQGTPPTSVTCKSGPWDARSTGEGAIGDMPMPQAHPLAGSQPGNAAAEVSAAGSSKQISADPAPWQGAGISRVPIIAGAATEHDSSDARGQRRPSSPRQAGMWHCAEALLWSHSEYWCHETFDQNHCKEDRASLIGWLWT